MNNDLILDFTALRKLAEQEKLSENGKKFIYLLWLGLTASEISSAYYNSTMRTVEWGDRTLFVKEDKIAECLAEDNSRPLDGSGISSALTELEKAGISAGHIYKMGFFNMRYEQSELNQPEDIVRIKEISRHISPDRSKLEKEYEDYCKIRRA